MVLPHTSVALDIFLRSRFPRFLFLYFSLFNSSGDNSPPELPLHSSSLHYCWQLYDSKVASCLYNCHLLLTLFNISRCFFSVFSMAVDTLFLCFLEDLERNDGTAQKPYYMSKSLRKILGKMEKTARLANYRLVASPTEQASATSKSGVDLPPRIYSGLYTVGLSDRGKDTSNRHSLASAYSHSERGPGIHRHSMTSTHRTNEREGGY